MIKWHAEADHVLIACKKKKRKEKRISNDPYYTKLSVYQ